MSATEEPLNVIKANVCNCRPRGQQRRPVVLHGECTCVANTKF